MSRIFSLCSPIVALVVVLLLSPQAAQARTAEEGALGEQAAAIAAGKYQTAIDLAEAAADSGLVHPDLSFNRGLAYLHRARSPQAKPGDYGQAAAGFREALLLRPTDPEATRGLERVRVAVARRGGAGASETSRSIGLSERLLLQLDADLLAAVAAIGSALLTLALFARQLARFRHSMEWLVTAIVGAFLLVPSTGLYFIAQAMRQSTERAMVVSERAPPLGDDGKPLRGVSPLGEATEVLVLDARGALVQLGGDASGQWLRRSQVRRMHSQLESNR